MITAGNHVSAGVATGAGTSATTAAIDATGASLLVVGVAWDDFGGNPTVSDSQGNTWTALTKRFTTFTAAAQLFYVANPSVGASQTFTVSGGANGDYSFAAMAFAGVATVSPFDVQNGAASGSSVTTLQTGSVTPSEDNELLVTVFGHNSGSSGTITIDSSFTKIEGFNYSSGVCSGMGFAYQIQTTATARNPAWSNTAGRPSACAIATFKQDAGGGGGAVENPAIRRFGLVEHAARRQFGREGVRLMRAFDGRVRLAA